MPLYLTRECQADLPGRQMAQRKNYLIRSAKMVKKSWIAAGLCIVIAVMLCATAYGEKEGKKCSLPTAIEAAVKAIFPNGVITDSKKEEEEIKVFKVEVKEGDKETDVKVAKDGTVMEVESDDSIETVPAAVAATIKAQNAELKEVSKEIEYAKLQVVVLDTPITTYSAEIIKDGKKIELEIAADGTIIEQEVKKCDKDKDDDDDDDDNGKGKDDDKDNDKDKD